ncbi:putative dimeric alpha-beta barrel protein [Daldinia childiae]|uniref:putative dimeric alpha-beta barrel protein n=1 Tax=Daldinia childiae TaxID=326645 RepID=UPI001447B41F|nr:putative dimeric alpha-beta barrel protein [Daldinia childiae]KAF3058362.1 putative dimeric alpha-beta barrel protein [Daldinia childiae]
MASEILLKIEAFHYKLESVTDEAFENYVCEVLIPKWVSIMKRHNVVRYTSTITPSSFAEQFGPALAKIRPDWSMLEAHFTRTYYVRNFDEMKAIIGDPDYQGKGGNIEVGWIDPSKGYVKVGWETVYIENGKVVNIVLEE